MVVHGGDDPMELCFDLGCFLSSWCVARMPPRCARQGRGGRGARDVPVQEAASGVHGGENQGEVPNPGAPVLPVNLMRELATAIVEATRAVPPANAANRAFEAMREFRRANPP